MTATCPTAIIRTNGEMVSSRSCMQSRWRSDHVTYLQVYLFDASLLFRISACILTLLDLWLVLPNGLIRSVDARLGSYLEAVQSSHFMDWTSRRADLQGEQAVVEPPTAMTDVIRCSRRTSEAPKEICNSRPDPHASTLSFNPLIVQIKCTGLSRACHWSNPQAVFVRLLCNPKPE